MARNREAFLSRWSRRKRDTVQSTPESTQPNRPTTPEAPPPELPPIDSLTHDSDFSGFMHKHVDDKLRRAALRKLFSDPSFNIADGLDEYAEDYTLLETLADGAAAGLEHAKSTLLGPHGDAGDAKPVADPVAGGTDAGDAHAAAVDAEAEDAAAQSPEDATAQAAIAAAEPAPDTVAPLADASNAAKR
jgi:hypothetical protein